MTRVPDATAEAVVGAVEAVVSGRGKMDAQGAAEFLDLPATNAIAALELAEDLALISLSGTTYAPSSPLSRLLVTPVLAQKAAVLRVAVESYEPYRCFRRRLHASGETPTVAAQQTKALLGLTEHHELIKQTLISLGTYCQSLRTAGGGLYEVRFEFEGSLISHLSATVAEMAESEMRVRDWLSEDVRNYIDTAAVLDPLTEAYLKVSQGDSRGAVVSAGNAIESFLTQVAADLAVNVSNAHGLGAKVSVLEQNNHIPKKIAAVGRYLGNVRNAADHGIDSDINKAWTIRDGTGEDYLRVSITFIECVFDIKEGRAPAL